MPDNKAEQQNDVELNIIEQSVATKIEDTLKAKNRATQDILIEAKETYAYISGIAKAIKEKDRNAFTDATVTYLAKAHEREGALTANKAIAARTRFLVTKIRALKIKNAIKSFEAKDYMPMGVLHKMRMSLGEAERESQQLHQLSVCLQTEVRLVQKELKPFRDAKKTLKSLSNDLKNKINADFDAALKKHAAIGK